MSTLSTSAASASPTTQPTRQGTFSSLRHRNYRLFFIGQLVSVCGTWMQSIALATYLLYRLDGGGRELGILSACNFTPVLVFGLWAGAIVDRGNKRRILIAAQALMGVAAVALTAMVIFDVVTFPLLCAIAAVTGVGNAFDMPARQSFISEMVPPESLQNAVALSSAIFNGGRVVGQAVAGVLVSVFGYAWCFGINAASFGAIIIGLIAMHTAELRPVVPMARAKGQVADGLRHVRQTPVLRTVLLLVLVIGIFSLNFQVFVPLVAKNVFHGREGKVALFQVFLASGSLVGALLAARRSGPSGRLIVRSAIIFALSMSGLAVSNVEPVTWALLFIMGGAFMTLLNTVNATLQLSSDPALRGRVMSVYTLVLVGSTPVGAPLAGWVADRFGARTSIAIGAVAAAIVCGGAILALGRGLLNAGRVEPSPQRR